MHFFGFDSQDHPRLRGNYGVLLRLYPSLLGSPPLTRELLMRRMNLNTRTRITPAYAGTTDCPAHFRTGWRDHPRLRGNYLYGDV